MTLENQGIVDSRFIYEDLIEDFDLTEIGSLSAIHDRHQFESKFNYELTSQTEENKEYEVDTYIFFPKSLGVNSSTYSRDDFYSDMTNYLRISSSDILQNTEERILPSLDKYFSVHLATYKRRKLMHIVVQEIKLLGCSINSKLKNLHYGLFQVLNKKSQEFLSEPSRAQGLKNLLQSIEELLYLYRHSYVQHAREQSFVLDEEVKQALLLVDEYSSYRLETVLVGICRLLQSYGEHFPDLILTIESILKKEIDYRSQVGLINIDEGGNAPEDYYYRLGLLKKYVSEVLFLKVTNIKKDKKYRNIVAAIGAALAALWASLANVQYWQTAPGSTLNLRLFTIIIIGIVAYVFKDRIKEWSKNYFNEQLKHRLPDFDRQMFYTQYTPEGEKKKCFLGVSTEFVRYLKKEVISPDVLYIREMRHNELEPKRHEVVIHYSKRLTFASKKIEKELINVQSVKDVVRFDFSKFLAKLDEPRKSLHYFDRSKGIMSVEAPKLYHINIVFRYIVYETVQQKRIRHIELERIRVILNKKGIVRIEEVVPRGEMNYQEPIYEY